MPRVILCLAGRSQGSGKWKRSNLGEVRVSKNRRSIGPSGKPSIFSNLCPEVSFDCFGRFVSNFAYHADEIDADIAHRKLAAEVGGTSHDWRWAWSSATPLHYADCPLYSLLLLGVNDTRRVPQ